MATNDTILVTGATGQQGGAVAKSLLRQGQKVRALSRNPAKAEGLKKLGAEVVAGDLTNRASLDAALRGAKKVFVVTTPFEAGMEAEVRQGITAADAAKAAGVEHLVYTSVGSAHKQTGIPHFETKWTAVAFPRQLQQPVREIIYRTSGQTHGPITRLMSPSDLGEILKPFVFLDLAGFDGRFAPMPMGFGWHPHSGIATVTVMLEGAVHYAETTGKEGVLPPGGVEWMRAGNGVWHTGAPEEGRVKAFQLWVALPPALENTANASHYVMPKDVPVEGPVRVILGEYGDAKSPIAAPPMSYLAVSLRAGERWTYHPPKGHTVAWVAVHEGVLRNSSPILSGEIAIFESSGESIDFIAEGNTGFVLGSAAKHPHDLVLGNYSVHTSAEALREGEAEIRRIGQNLRADGTLRR